VVNGNCYRKSCITRYVMTSNGMPCTNSFTGLDKYHAWGKNFYLELSARRDMFETIVYCPH